MNNLIPLSKAENKKKYRICELQTKNKDTLEMLSRLGFVEDTTIQIPTIRASDPAIYYLRGIRVALRKNETKHILVEEV